MERTQKLLTDTHTHTHTHTQRERKDKNYIHPIALPTSYAGGITRVTVHVSCKSSRGLTSVKFHENMSGSFKLMERT